MRNSLIFIGQVLAVSAIGAAIGGVVHMFTLLVG